MTTRVQHNHFLFLRRRLWLAGVVRWARAREEGYDLATDTNGREWDCNTGEATGKVLRLPKPAPEGMVRDFVDKLKSEKK